MYRYGVDLANKFLENFKDDKSPKWLACNLKSEKPSYDCAYYISPKDNGTCGIRVLGFSNAEKMVLK